jgi:hypothetical protein
MAYLYASITFVLILGACIYAFSKLVDHFHQHAANDDPDRDGDFCGWSDGRPVATGHWPDVMAARALNSPVHDEGSSQ